MCDGVLALALCEDSGLMVYDAVSLGKRLAAGP